MNKEPFIKNNDELLHLDSWQHLSSPLVVGFTTKDTSYGSSIEAYASFNLGVHVNDKHEHVMMNRTKLGETLSYPIHKWVCAEQVHEATVAKVTTDDKGKGIYVYEEGIRGTDGIYTREKDVLLTSCYADCVPLYFYAPKHDAIGLAHAGWKGTVKNIAGEMIQVWTEDEHIPLEDIHVAIGPCIHACCYIVDDRVINAVKEILPANQHASVYEQVSDGQYRIDLQEVNRLLFVNMGIPKEQITLSSYCTSCEDKLFFSHRRDKGKTGRMLSFIGFKGEGM
ncbi:peptidoglycan editing factor PgeF [Priestia taiwanensis]|uniref:Purine nucleoside phosphorylase n=1 Tax=Priestia taiwanensis TaxID=1347902 RepID=A0A917AS41_9BACI|nr:peptidoglycan editing factor PgeF [Priestia taiwanensis]MBM7362926.1 YfiH family protein [Priestia taiwanensis]GGE66228.1 laccase domain protein [Priestia taiwanensis]